MRTKANAEVRQVREARSAVNGVGAWTWRSVTFVVAVLAGVLMPRSGAASPPFKAPPKRGSVQAAAPAQVERVRYIADDHSTRVIVLLSRSVPYEVRVLPGEASRGSERRVVLDFSNATLGAEAAAPIGIEDGLLKQIRTGQFTARTARVVIDLVSVTGYHVSELKEPPGVVVDIAGHPTLASAASPARDAGGAAAAATPRDTAPLPEATPVAPATREAVAVDGDAPGPHRERASTAAVASAPSALPEQAPAAEASRAPSVPLARATPWRIVLDAGHGGNDPGTLGVDGVYEKDVTLAIAKQLKRRLEGGLGAQVLLTRDRDVTRSLAQRTALANASNADLFVSIHANADASGELHGVETYTLNNTNDRAAIRLAKMENGPGVRTGRGDLSFILSDMVQSGKEEESIALANRLQRHLVARLRTHYPDIRSLGVKKGPFYVLVGAYMPCVLVETSFLTHPIEGRRLASPEYQAEVVEGLYLGMTDFLGDQRLAKTL